MKLTDAQALVLRALQEENDKGPYREPRYRTAYEVALRAARSLSTCSKHLSALADQGLVISTARSGRKGGWKINDAGRAVLEERDDA